jgi:hypothetical protein
VPPSANPSGVVELSTYSEAPSRWVVRGILVVQHFETLLAPAQANVFRWAYFIHGF